MAKSIPLNTRTPGADTRGGCPGFASGWLRRHADDRKEMRMKELEGKTAIVVGSSRGFGRGITEAFLDAGARVVAVARNPAPLTELAGQRPALPLVAADATGPVGAGNPPLQPPPGRSGPGRRAGALTWP